MKVPIRVPCRAGSAWNSGACSTVKPGRKCASSAGRARMNMLRTNSACHALGVMNRTGRRYARVGAAEQILHEELARVEIAAHVLVQPVERRSGSSRGFFSHQIRSAGAGLLDHELVLGRPAGVRRGDGGEGAAIGELSFAAAEGVLEQRGGREVGVDADGKEAMLDEGKALARNCARLGAHTLQWRVAARQRTQRPGRDGRAPAGNYRQVPGRGQLRHLGRQGLTGSTSAARGRGPRRWSDPARSAASTDGSTNMRSEAFAEWRKMPRRAPARGRSSAPGRSSSPGVPGADRGVDVDPDRQTQLGVVVADVEVGRAGALRRERAVEPGHARTGGRAADARRARSHRRCSSRSRPSRRTHRTESRPPRRDARAARLRAGGRGILDPDPDRQPVRPASGS